jgi:uncharacterized protein YqjF (DUF2071 family)
MSSGTFLPLSTIPLPTDAQRLAVRERPAGRPVMDQTWERLLFLHWRFPAEAIQANLPRGLYVDTFEGEAWVGVVPFFMRKIRVRKLPPIPGTVNFLELNLRTYVHDEQGTPGVWFFSLDANSRLVVHVARRWYRLPYWPARLSAEIDAATNRVDYRCHRRGHAAETASRFAYQPRGELREATPGTLEFFLIERYVLFTEAGPGRIASGRVHHVPYRFADAVLSGWDDRLIGLNGLPRPGREPDHAVVASGVTVEVFGLEALAGNRRLTRLQVEA